MKILIHSNAPWVGSGYGRQTRLLAYKLQQDGHAVVVSAINGLHGASIDWTDPDYTDAKPIRVLPAGQYGFGVDTLPAYIAEEHPDLVLTIMDCRMLGPIAGVLQSAPLACWVPADCSPLSKPERAFLEASGALPVAMTRWGEQQLRDAGFEDTVYIPHMVDTTVYSWDYDNESGEPAGVDERRRVGIPEDAFVIGMVAANSDAVRKGFPEQFEAFRRFRKHNEKAHLVVHTVARSAEGWNLEELAMEFGIHDDVSFSQPLPQLVGLIDDQHMATLYRAFDVLSICSYGEGFGVPMIEAMSCGTPVVATDFGAMREIAKDTGFLVTGEPFWNPVHKGWWTRPHIGSIVAGYQYFAMLKGKQQWYERYRQCRQRAADYDTDVVYNECWRPFLNDWEPMMGAVAQAEAAADQALDAYIAAEPAVELP